MVRSPLNARILVREDTYLRLIHMIIVPLIRAANEHDDEILSLIDGMIANWGFEKMPMLFEPLGDVDWGQETHISSLPRWDGGKRRDERLRFIIIFCGRVDRDYDRLRGPS